jgi:hypothetical protein
MKNVVFLRNKNDGLSATEFTECLIGIKNQINEPSANSGDIYEKCFMFLPDFYTKEMKYNYINDALKYKEYLK